MKEIEYVVKKEPHVMLVTYRPTYCDQINCNYVYYLGLIGLDFVAMLLGVCGSVKLTS